MSRKSWIFWVSLSVAAILFNGALAIVHIFTGNFPLFLLAVICVAANIWSFSVFYNIGIED